MAAEPPSLFVSVASYRDPACSRTLRSMFESAAHPERITAGVCVQNAPDDPECAAEHRHRVVGVSMSHLQARGPMYARWVCSRLWRGQDFYVQVDSHTTFVQDWDVQIVRQWRGLRDPRAVLTAYPPQAWDEDLVNGNSAVRMCGASFLDDDSVNFAAQEINADAEPQPTQFLAAGFVFMPRAALLEGPLFDRDLPWLFWYEELLMASRLYTRGFNLYSPAQAVCKHDYDRGEDAPSVYNDAVEGWEEEKRASEALAREMLGWRPDGTQVWLTAPRQGSVRPIGQYMREAGLDWPNRKANRQCDWQRDPSLIRR